MTMSKTSSTVMTLTALLLLVGLFMSAVHAAKRDTCYAVAGGGAWDNNSTWTDCPNGIPTENDDVYLDGVDVVVTIPSAFAAQAYQVYVGGRASLVIAEGSLRTSSVGLENAAKLTSTGVLNLVSIDGERTSLTCSGSTISLDHGVAMTNEEYSTEVSFDDCEVMIAGSVELNSTLNSAEFKATTASNVVVKGDVILHGGVVPFADGKKRGGGDPTGVIVAVSSLQIGGNLTVLTDPINENTTAMAEGTGDASIMFHGGSLRVGGHVTVRSGDALYGYTGNAIVITQFDVFNTMMMSSFMGLETLYQTTQSEFVVGGSLTVETGSATGVRDDGNQGFPAGDAVINLAKTVLLVNGSAESSITVRCGHSGNSTANGGSVNGDNENQYAGTTQFIMGFYSEVAVSKDLVVESGNGGGSNMTDGQGNGGDAKAAFFRLVGGVDATIGGNLIVRGGNGGDSDGQYGRGGFGGEAVGYLGLGGSLNVGGDVWIASGAAGKGLIGGDAFQAAFYVGTSIAALEPSKSIPFPVIPVNRGPMGMFTTPNTGKLDMRVGGSVTINGGKAGSSNYSSAPGGQCNEAIPVGSIEASGGGFVVESAWEGNVAIGGDVTISGCTPGGSVGSSGQNAGTNMLLVLYGGSVTVGGSVSVSGADGGYTYNAESGNSAGNGGSSHVWAIGHATLDVAGSVAVSNGNGGGVIDGTSSPGSGYSDGYSPLLLVANNAHVAVGRDVTLKGGNGGNVDAIMTSGSSAPGGDPLVVTLSVIDVSTLTVNGNVVLSSGAFGNSMTNMSYNDDRRQELQQQQKQARKVALPERVTNLLRDSQASSEEDVPTKRVEQWDNTETTVEVISALLHVKGSLTMQHPTRQNNNLNSPASGTMTKLAASVAASVTVEGDVSITGGSGGITESESAFFLDGGMAMIDVSSLAAVKLGGNVVLQGGDAAKLANGNDTGVQGVAFVKLHRGELHQLGRVRLIDGQGQPFPEKGASRNLVKEEVEVGVSMWRSQWTVYPCPGAGLQMAEGRDGSSIIVEAQSSLRDCRSASSRQQDYGSPTVDATSCSPCSCSEAPFNTCPNFSSASRGAESALLACLRALVDLVWSF